MHVTRRTWFVGGVALIACGVFGLLRTPLFGPPLYVAGVMTDLAWAGALLLLAIGFTRRESVLGRSALGIVAVAVVALWPLVNRTLLRALDLALAPSFESWPMWRYALSLLPLVAALIAAVLIAGAGTVPSPWKWAPLWAVGIQLLVWVAAQVVLTGFSSSDLQQLAIVVVALAALPFAVNTFVLGAIAVWLGTQRRSTTIPDQPVAQDVDN